MKKALALFLALVLSMSLMTACGSKKEETPAAAPESGETSSEALPGEGMKIALVCDTVGTQVFLTQMVDALNEAAEKYGLGYNLVAGANIAGFQRVADAMMAQGIF